jgi:NAD(P)H dehydrogenase (quinone)
MKILVAYYSRSGNTKKMAEAVGKGAKKAGVDVDVKDVTTVNVDDLPQYDAFIFGSPTYYGLMAAEVKKLLDDSITYHGKLSGKVGGAFTSAGGIGGGAETTVLSILEALLIHGMVVTGEAGNFHYGPVAIGKPDEKVLTACTKYGTKVAELTKKTLEGK